MEVTLAALLLRGALQGAVAVPWGIALLLHPSLTALWVFGAVVGELWLALIGAKRGIGFYTLLLSVIGAALGLVLHWFLLIFLIPLFLLECDLLFFLAPRKKQIIPPALGSPDCRVQFYRAVAKAVGEQGHSRVTWKDVAVVHEKLKGGEKPTDSLEQVIAWTLWYRLNGLDKEEYD